MALSDVRSAFPSLGQRVVDKCVETEPEGDDRTIVTSKARCQTLFVLIKRSQNKWLWRRPEAEGHKEVQ